MEKSCSFKNREVLKAFSYDITELLQLLLSWVPHLHIYLSEELFQVIYQLANLRGFPSIIMKAKNWKLPQFATAISGKYTKNTTKI